MAEVPAEVDTSVATETPAVEAAPEPVSTAEQVETPVEEKPEPEEAKLTQSEVNKIVAKRVAQAERSALKIARAEAEAAHYKRLHEESQRQVQPEGAPKFQDFQDVDAYLAAHTKHELAQARKQWEQDQARERETQSARERAMSAKSRLDGYVSKHPELEEFFSDDASPITMAMGSFLVESDKGAEVGLYLKDNPQDALRIANLSPVMQVRELDRIETKLSAAPKPTKVPAPITPSGGKATVEKDWHELSDKEFDERRRRQIAQRNGR